MNMLNSLLFQGILYGMVALGPALGFLMGSALLSQWINIGNDQIRDEISTNDPRWVGRWWAGFLVSSTSLIILSIILSTFPSTLSSEVSDSKGKTESSQSTDSIFALGQAATRKHSLPKMSHPIQCQSMCQSEKFKGFAFRLIFIDPSQSSMFI